MYPVFLKSVNNLHLIRILLSSGCLLTLLSDQLSVKIFILRSRILP